MVNKVKLKQKVCVFVPIYRHENVNIIILEASDI